MTTITVFVSLVLFCSLLSLYIWFNKTRSFDYFRNKHVFITGASSGIGKSLAIYLATAKSARVSLAARSLNKLEDICKSIQEKGGSAQVIYLDLCDSSSFTKALEQSTKGFGNIDILIANAAVNNDGLCFTSLSLEQIDKVMQTNLRGTILFIHLVLMNMMKDNGGHIVGISSLAGYRGLPMGSIYGATKAALSNLLESLRIELYHTNVHITTIHPGFIDTPAIQGMKHPKLFLLSAETAAKKITNAVASRKYTYGFPWVMEHIVMRFIRYLPETVFVPLLYFLTRKNFA
ncbi:hypothetical protein GpartN1_g2220.t1 [Galdieria partita]|uniref:Uncharacterized protein n=1 Tax=Galdieria partita TaxID=83374 RepID=A0A9C7PUG0_9RHOD|nr:hypothetical protein GpartN1_g2220.t1 [Galdieria partita]